MPREAVVYGASCPQPGLVEGVPIGLEDCLFLNVFRPTSASASTKLPVMVFIHGGSFIGGSGELYVDSIVSDGLCKCGKRLVTVPSCSLTMWPTHVAGTNWCTVPSQLHLQVPRLPHVRW